MNGQQSHQTTVYPAAFFDIYIYPHNALEMINRLPGFSFDEGTGERGVGGNAGNVLIDGIRPTVKSGGLAGALTRMPSQQVVRIEILPGNTGEAKLAANVKALKHKIF